MEKAIVRCSIRACCYDLGVSLSVRRTIELRPARVDCEPDAVESEKETKEL